MQPVRDVTFAKRLRNPFRRTRLRVIRQPDRVLLKVVGGRKRHRKKFARWLKRVWEHAWVDYPSTGAGAE